MTIQVTAQFKYTYLDDLENKFKTDTHIYVKRYLNRCLEQRLSNLNIEKRKEAFYMLSKIDKLELKYLTYVRKYIYSKYKLFKYIYHSFSITVLTEYMKTLQEFINFTSNNSNDYLGRNYTWNFICTLINITWQKRFQAILDETYPGKYIVDRNYTPILIN